MSEVIATGTKSGVKLEEYKGTYSLTAQQEGNGKYWPTWAKYKKNKDEYQEKDWTVKVTLGSQETAIATLTWLLKELSGTAKAPSSAPPSGYGPGPDAMDDVPF